MDLATSIISLISSIIAFITTVLAVFTISNVTNYIKNSTINSHNTITNNYTNVAHKFQKIYSPEKWQLKNNRYLLTIPKSEHAINNPCSIIVQRLDKGLWTEVIVNKTLHDDGTIEIIANITFEVKVIIM